MSRVCTVCGKGRMSGNQVSHSNRKTRRSWAPNVQKVKVKTTTGGVEEVGKVVGRLSQGADAVGGGEGGDVQEDSAAAVHRDHPFCNDLPLIVVAILWFVKKITEGAEQFWQIA